MDERIILSAIRTLVRHDTAESRRVATELVDLLDGELAKRAAEDKPSLDAVCVEAIKAETQSPSAKPKKAQLTYRAATPLDVGEAVEVSDDGIHWRGIGRVLKRCFFDGYEVEPHIGLDHETHTSYNHARILSDYRTATPEDVGKQVWFMDFHTNGKAHPGILTNVACGLRKFVDSEYKYWPFAIIENE